MKPAFVTEATAPARNSAAQFEADYEDVGEAGSRFTAVWVVVTIDNTLED